VLKRDFLAAVAVGLLGAASPVLAAAAQEPALVEQPAQGAAAASPARDDGRRTMGRFVSNLFRGTVGIFSTDNVKPLLIGGAATGLGAVFDHDVAAAIADPSDGFGMSFESGAQPAVIGGVVAVLFAAGRASDAGRFRATTYDWMHAFLINAGYTVLVKEVVRRERPNGEDQRSFPSGHASNAFALAAVAQGHYGWKAGVPGYALAGVIAVSRLQRNAHYLSDVLAGATLGYIVGRTVVRVNGQALDSPRRAQFSLSPVITKRTRGLVASVEF
jgi:membrane-associated phospholipid phosphatase